jgi:ammonia channel protein AmtB
MLESGCVSIKNEVNIMMKNVADVVLGGLTYWMFGFALSFGNGPCTTPFMGCGNFFVDPTVNDPLMGPINAAFLFQLSFATTATTIVSGAMAERCVRLFKIMNCHIFGRCLPNFDLTKSTPGGKYKMDADVLSLKFNILYPYND